MCSAHRADNDLIFVIRSHSRFRSIASGILTEYCVDFDEIWIELPADTQTVSINEGQTLSFRGNLTPNSSNGIGTFTVDKNYDLKGNVMSMLFGDKARNNFSLNAKNYAFYKLFYNNNTLKTISSNFLPATTLADSCYYRMFYNCKLLTTAPELPATTLASSCYSSMFRGCIRLNYIKMLATDISASVCLSNWVNNVSTSGTFVKHPDMTSLPTGTSGIPSGWTVEDAVI